MQKDIFILGGGMDQVTPPMAVPPGKLIHGTNYEADVNGGYRRMPGYERFDGRTSPSRASYFVAVVVLTGTVQPGQTITGQTSGASGIVLRVNGTSELILVAVSGTFLQETILVGAVVVGTVSRVTRDTAATPALHENYKFLAAEHHRQFITMVPGSGPVRGVWEYLGVIYAFRNNAAGNACNMWRASTTGWQQIIPGVELQFTGAVAEIFEGNTVTGAVSGANGVVRRALLRTGTWTTNGVGTLVFDSITGVFQHGENLTVSAAIRAVANGASSPITLAPGGRFTFDNYNFTATSAGLRMYFTDGVNHLHEFDGVRLVPIRNGITNSQPRFVTGHQRHLVIAVQSSIQVSGIGNPYSWTALTGAAELALGETCTGVLRQVSDGNTGVLFITTEHKSFLLYGNDINNFRLVLHSPESGGYPYTLQNIGNAYYLDARGVVSMTASDVFGGFTLAVNTRDVQPFIDSKRGKAVASCVVKAKNQYRIFFNDGTGAVLHARAGPNGLQMETTTYEARLPAGGFFNTVFSYVEKDGEERIFAGGSNGFVYELDMGTSADGDLWGSEFLTVFTHSRSPRQRKRYRRTTLQFEATGTVDVNIGYDLSFGSREPSFGVIMRTASSVGLGGYWSSFTWNRFTWDAPYAQEFNIDTPGNGVSIALIISTNSRTQPTHRFTTAAVHYLPGRVER